MNKAAVDSMSFYVTKIQQCKRCNGSGLIRHPEWEDYWMEYREYFPHGTTNGLAIVDFDSAYWRRQGYHPCDVPSEQISCPDCEGMGTIRTEVPLEEALMALKPVLSCLMKADSYPSFLDEALNSGDGVYRP